MAYIVTASIVMAYTVMALADRLLRRPRLDDRTIHSFGLSGYGLYITLAYIVMADEDMAYL